MTANANANANANTNTNRNTPARESAEQREQRMQRLDDHIGRSLADSSASGELRSAPSFGKPLNLGDGYAQTPEELRMGYKMLKDAGFVPPEVELMQQIEALRQSIALETHADAAAAGRQRLSAMQQQLTMRLDKLRTTGAL